MARGKSLSADQRKALLREFTRGARTLTHLEHTEEPREPCAAFKTGCRQLYNPETTGSERMTEYDFTLKYKLAEDDADVDALTERLGEGGCDDALVGMDHKGRLALNFTREGASAKQAILSALKDVNAIIPGARLVEAA